MKKVYLAGALFSEAETDWLRKFKYEIEHFCHVIVYWPGELISNEVIQKSTDPKCYIFNSCLDYLNKSDIVIACIDGTQVDDGTSWEIGYAYAHNKPIFGVRTDFRCSGDAINAIVNSMIAHSLRGYAYNRQTMIEMLNDYIESL